MEGGSLKIVVARKRVVDNHLKLGITFMRAGKNLFVDDRGEEKVTGNQL